MVELVELSNSRMVEWWNGGVSGVVELSNRRMVNQCNGGIGGVVESSNSGMVKWSSCWSCRTVEWWS